MARIFTSKNTFLRASGHQESFPTLVKMNSYHRVTQTVLAKFVALQLATSLPFSVLFNFLYLNFAFAWSFL